MMLRRSWSTEGSFAAWNLNCQENPYGQICFNFFFFYRLFFPTSDGIYTIGCTYFFHKLLLHILHFFLSWCIECILRSKVITTKGAKEMKFAYEWLHTFFNFSFSLSLTHSLANKSGWHIGEGNDDGKRCKGSLKCLRTNWEMRLRQIVRS